MGVWIVYPSSVGGWLQSLVHPLRQRVLNKRFEDFGDHGQGEIAATELGAGWGQEVVVRRVEPVGQDHGGGWGRAEKTVRFTVAVSDLNLARQWSRDKEVSNQTKSTIETKGKARIRWSIHEPSFIHQWRLHNFRSFLHISNKILVWIEFHIEVVESVYSKETHYKLAMNKTWFTIW